MLHLHAKRVSWMEFSMARRRARLSRSDLGFPLEILAQSVVSKVIADWLSKKQSSQVGNQVSSSTEVPVLKQTNSCPVTTPNYLRLCFSLAFRLLGVDNWSDDNQTQSKPSSALTQFALARSREKIVKAIQWSANKTKRDENGQEIHKARRRRPFHPHSAVPSRAKCMRRRNYFTNRLRGVSQACRGWLRLHVLRWHDNFSAC